MKAIILIVLYNITRDNLKLDKIKLKIYKYILINEMGNYSSNLDKENC